MKNLNIKNYIKFVPIKILKQESISNILNDVTKFISDKYGIEITNEDAPIILEELKNIRSEIIKNIRDNVSTLEKAKNLSMNTIRVVSMDRNNWISETEIDIDPRWPGFSVNYIPIMEESYSGSYPFDDDHYRAINANFTNTRFRPAGRDDRDFHINRSEEVEKIFASLNSRAKEIKSEIKNKRMDSTLFEPKYIKPEVYIDRHTHETFDADDGWESEIIETYYVLWIVRDDDGGSMELKSTKVDSYHDAKKIVDQNNITDDLNDSKKELQKEYDIFLENSGINSLNEELYKINNELDKFTKPEKLNVNIKLYSQNSNRHKELIPELSDKERESLFNSASNNVEKKEELEALNEPKLKKRKNIKQPSGLGNNIFAKLSNKEESITDVKKVTLTKAPKITNSHKKEKLRIDIQKKTDDLLEYAVETFNSLLSEENAKKAIKNLTQGYINKKRDDNRPGNLFAWRKSAKNPVIDHISLKDLEEILFEMAENYE